MMSFGHCVHVFPAVPHWRPEGALGEPGGDRRHSHAAGFPAPAAGRDSPPGGETEVQHCAGKQESAHSRSTCQAQLHRLARRSDTGFYLIPPTWGCLKKQHISLLKESFKEYCLYLHTLQVLSSGHYRTSWAAGRCHENITVRQAESQTGAAWVPLLPNLSTKQERRRLRSWREPSPQRSRLCCCISQTVYSPLPDRALQ